MKTPGRDAGGEEIGHKGSSSGEEETHERVQP